MLCYNQNLFSSYYQNHVQQQTKFNITMYEFIEFQKVVAMKITHI